MSINKEGFKDWKANPVTKAVFNEIHRRILDSRELLGNTAGIDSLNDRYIAGAIAAYSDFLNIDFGEVSDGT